MDAIVWFFVLGFLHGFGKAMRDTVAHHFQRSIFTNAPGRWYVWFKSDWRDRPDHWFAPIWDAWHFGDALTSLSPIVGLFLATYFYVPWVVVLFYTTVYGIIFHLLYKQLFLIKLKSTRRSK